MADTLHLQVATPERQLVDDQATQVEIPGKNGYLGVLPGHAPLLSELGAGVLSYSSSSETQDRLLVIEGGFVEVLNNEVRVLAERAEFGREIDFDRARQQLADAQQAIQETDTAEEADRALRKLAIAQARVEAAERAR
jgi:F-type H+-transporting ATPase subunit epsilon